jgi:glycosyltransferase involved in cell wall biosynthesis
MARFSIIVPNYNHGRFLRQRMDSIMEQHFQDFEVIILDDGSTDESPAVIEAYRHHPKVASIHYNRQNSGSPFLQWKKGIALAAGDWVWIAESDDYSDPAFLNEAEKAIDSFPSIGLFYCDSFIVNDAGGPAMKKMSERKNNIFNSSKWSSNYFNPGTVEIDEYLKLDCTINNASAIIFKKSVVSGFLNELEKFRFYGDWYVILRTCLKADVYYNAQPLNYYRKHNESLTHTDSPVAALRKEYFRILKLLYYEPAISEKNKLLNFFAFNYLAFGLKQDGWKTGFRIINSYIQLDKRLAGKIIYRLALIKLFRKDWSYEFRNAYTMY